MSVKIGTFNAENLFLRYKFLATERGSMRKKKVDISKFINEGGHINIFEVTILTINWIVLIASGALPSVLFRRSGGDRP